MKSLLWLENNQSIPEEISVQLPLSKSISNRVLILNVISNGKIHSKKYSTASDTNILQECLKNLNSVVYDVRDAGTSFRFITALAALGDHEVTISGTDRMKKRPVKGLVEVLIKLGAQVTFTEQDGYPPIKINPPAEGLYFNKNLIIQDTSSSQFISALMLIAPKIKGGLNLSFPSDIPSYSYIKMTAEIMNLAGIEVQLKRGAVIISEQAIDKRDVLIDIERDWSGASYFFSMMSLGNWPKIYLPFLNLDSIQKDARICEYFEPLGIKAEQTRKGVLLTKYQVLIPKNLIFDFGDNPDLAMTVIIAYAVNKVDIKVIGIENLVIKESNRIEAIKNELAKINVQFYIEDKFWQLKTSGLRIPKELSIKTYNDHRIAMAFSALAIKAKVGIENPDVVNKSFPDFWDQLSSMGLSTNVL